MFSRNALLKACGGIAFAAGAGIAPDASAALTIDLRMADTGAREIPGELAVPGSKFLVDIWLTVTGTSTDVQNNYGLGRVQGSIVSQGHGWVNIAGGKGDLDLWRKTPQQTTALRPFAQDGEQPGNEVDLDGDGDIDLGAPNQDDITGFIVIRSDPLQSLGSSDAIRALPAGNGIEAPVGRVEVTVLNEVAVGTELVWLPRRNADGTINENAASWFDDEGGPSPKRPQDGTMLTSPLVFIPEPGAITSTFGAAALLLRRRRRHRA